MVATVSAGRTLRPPFRVEWEPEGGYDTLCGAYVIYDSTDTSENIHGETANQKVFAVELAEFQDDNAGWDSFDSHAPCPEAERVANIVCAALNKEWER